MTNKRLKPHLKIFFVVKAVKYLIILAIWLSNQGMASANILTDVLKDGAGIRPLGMGGAFVGVANDSNAVFYNPGGLSAAGTEYTRSYMDMNSDFYPVNEGYYIVSNGSGIGYLNRWDGTFGRAAVTSFSFARAGEGGMAWGLTYKNIAYVSNLGSGRGWTMDAGIKFDLTREIKAGLLLQDVFKTDVPTNTTIRVGAGMFPLSLKNTVLAIDGEFRDLKSKKGATILMHYGLETKLSEGLLVRAGWDKTRFTAGASFSMGYCDIDYAVMINQEDKNMHMFGFKFVDNSAN